MTLDRLAKVLHVDEVSLMHGPKGVAVHVRIEKSWHSATIDNDDLEDNRLEVIAETLAHLADAHIHKVRGGEALRKANAATQAALQADAAAAERRRYGLSWADVGGWKPYGANPQQQIQRVETMPRAEPPPAVSSEPAVSKAMPSRFHAIIEELKNL